MSMTDETNGLYPWATKSFHKSTRKGKDKQTNQEENKGRGERLLEDLQLAGWWVHEETLALVISKSQVRPVRAIWKYENEEERLQNRREKTRPDVTLSNISYKLAMCKPFDPMTPCAGIYSKDTLSYFDIHRALGRQCSRGWAQALSAHVAPGAFKFHGPELLLGSPWAHIPIHPT